MKNSSQTKTNKQPQKKGEGGNDFTSWGHFRRLSQSQAFPSGVSLPFPRNTINFLEVAQPANRSADDWPDALLADELDHDFELLSRNHGCSLQFGVQFKFSFFFKKKIKKKRAGIDRFILGETVIPY